jgi:hypothetical protein
MSVVLKTTMVPEAQLTMKFSSAPETARQRCRNGRHVLAAERHRIKCLRAINVCNDPVTVYSAWTGVVKGSFGQCLLTP